MDARPHARILRLACAAGVAALLGAATAAPVAQGAFGVEERNFEAGTCVVASCTYTGVEADHGEAYTQAAGHPPYGLTGFELNSTAAGLGREPIGSLKRVRVDVLPGLAADPQALPQCPVAAFDKDECPADTQVGEDQLTVFVALADATITAPVYDLEQPPGLPLEFGIHASVPAVANEHVLLEGHVAWNTDYHEYFEINDISRAIPVLKSKLIFNGRAGEGDFLTLPSTCSNTTTSHLEVESWEGEVARTQTHTPVGVEGCGAVPFAPLAEVHPETAQSDEPDGATVEVKVPQHAGPEEIDTADIQDAHVTLPEGLTLDPSAAHGLAVCTEAQAGLAEVAHPAVPGERPTTPVTCPAAAKVGSVAIETDLPPGSLAGTVYLGSPSGATITGPPYTIYLDAESALGVAVRLRGQIDPNPLTGRLETTFAGNPPLPFGALAIKLDGGPRAPLANPLGCAVGQVQARFTPYTGGGATLSSTPFTATGCPAPVPFALTQSTHDASPTAGAPTSYTFDLARADGQQYLSAVRTTLPAGLLGVIPSVEALCTEPRAAAGTCLAPSEIGTATVAVGAGPEPYVFTGAVYLTGPYGGAPYGLSIAVPAIVGSPPTPTFDLGEVVTRAQVGVDPYTGRVTVTATLPTIVGGVPLRLRTIEVTINRPGFLINPTNCGALATESTLTGFGAGGAPFMGATATQSVSSPFQVGECDKLPFKPSLRASTGAKTSRLDGASLNVTFSQGPHQANVAQVLTTLPRQLVARLSTLHKACPAASFEAGPPPGGCTSEAQVGSATATTPVLRPAVCTACSRAPGRRLRPGARPEPAPNLTGSAYFVSHGGEAFPDLDVVLRGDGITVVLVGHTHISRTGVTSTSFESLPDVPVTSFSLTLPRGPHSVLTANGSLCATRLAMPTTIVAQSGARVTARIPIAVTGCTCPRRAHHLQLSHVGHRPAGTCPSRSHRHRRRRSRRP